MNNITQDLMKAENELEKLKEINDSMVTKYAKAIIHNLKLRVEIEQCRESNKEVTEKMEHYEKALKAVKHHLETIGGGNDMPPNAYSIVCGAL